MSALSNSQAESVSLPILPAAPLPVSQLESLKFKAAQIIESINALAWTIKNSDLAAMPSWPDILSKYNILLSQTLNFSNALLATQTIRPTTIGGPTLQHNIFERIAIHPVTGMSEQELDSEAAPLLRNQQTLDVLKMENEIVKRLADHMTTRGSLGVLGAPPPATSNGLGYGIATQPKKPDYEDVMRECAEIRAAHDQRVDRAVRAVMMLREKFEWKQRVEVEVEEPEELDWDPRFGQTTSASAANPANAGAIDEVMLEDGKEEDDEGSSDEDQANVEVELVNPGGIALDGQSPGLFSSTASGAGNTPTPADIPMN